MSVLGLAALLGLVDGASFAYGQPLEAPTLPERTASRGAGRSLLVYPEQRILLRVNHAHPAHRELACARCHEQALESTRSADLLLPSERACAACHAETDRAAPSVEGCRLCHVGARLPASEQESARDAGLVGRIFIPASRFPAPRITFSHASHAHVSGGCARCHAGVERADTATRAHLPTMRTCLECHAVDGLGGGERAGAGDPPPPAMACAACHESLPDGRLRSRFREGAMNPPRWMAGMHHDDDWIVRHRWVGADSGSLCASCHTERDCAACHDGRVRSRRVHPGDYLSAHPTEARRDEARCASCHSAGTFCSECHARLGLASFSAPRARGSGSPHPPAAIWSRGPALHGVEARRSLSSCVSCHAERDCVACHGSGTIGAGGVSPHPPGFEARCRPLLEASPSACARCHGSLESLRTSCRGG